MCPDVVPQVENIDAEPLPYLDDGGIRGVDEAQK
ncbi:Uncharacterised protein [Mycobacteroides abscessus subsp. abscessus]|nr:Uncharacterised protein [Mycobacteroides abscessus subsp. abscessus]